MVRWLADAALVLALAAAADAKALCFYGGQLYAKTTLAQEFRDSSVVVRGRVVSARAVDIPDPEQDWGTRYRIRVERVFKGHPPSRLTDFTERDSGGFYLDRGKDYLLFLNPVAGGEWARYEPGVLMVNYSCGQSRPWRAVSTNARRQLARSRTTANASTAWRPTLAQVTSLEAKLQLPAGARPIAEYARYYKGVVIQGRRLIEGYLLQGHGAPGIYLKPFADEIDDGGCSVITVYFDVSADRVAGVSCNGYA